MRDTKRTTLLTILAGLGLWGMCGMTSFASSTTDGYVFTKENRSLPIIPSSCFEEKDYCSNSTVEDAPAFKFIRVNFYAFVAKDKFKTIDELTGRYFDFSAWGENAYRTIEIRTSMRLAPAYSSRVNANRNYVNEIWHFIDYKMKVPGTAISTNVRELSSYWEIPAYDSAGKSFRFEALSGNDLPVMIPGVGEYAAPAGFISKSGLIHIQEYADADKDGFIIYLVTDIRPESQWFMGMAQDAIQNSIEDTAKTMFDIAD